MSGPDQPLRNARSQSNARPGDGRASPLARGGSDIAPALYLMTLEGVRLLQRVGEILVILAVFRPAEPLDRRKLVLGEIEFSLDDVSFAEIFALLRIGRVERNRPQIVIDPFV